MKFFKILTKKKEEENEDPKPEPKELKPKSLQGRINNMEEAFNLIIQKDKEIKKLKKKKFRIPYNVKGQLKKLATKNKVQVLLLQRTRNIKATLGEIRDGMLLVGDQIYNGSVNSTWLWDGKYPTHIVPEWDLQPLNIETIKDVKKSSTLGPDELYKNCLANQRSSEPQKIIIRAMEAKQNQMLAGKLNPKTIIITVIVVIIVIAILFGGGFV